MVDGDELFAIEVAAALGEYLVFDVKTSGTGAGVIDDSAADHFAFAKAGVSISDERQAAGIGDFADEAGEVIKGEDADIGHTGTDSGGGTGDIAAFESGIANDHGAEGVECPGECNAVLVHEGTKCLTLRIHGRRVEPMEGGYTLGMLTTSLATSLVCATVGLAANAPLPPMTAEAIKGVSADRCREVVDTLASFGTRHTLSKEEPNRGAAASRQWIRAQLEAANPGKLTVVFDEFDVPKMPRLPAGAHLVNVVATLPGSSPSAAQRVVYVVGHYDSINADTMDPTRDAPGANDNASGTTVMMECARVASKLKLDATVVFMASAAEEQGLVGAKYHAQALAAAKKYTQVFVLNNDIVGDTSIPFTSAAAISGNGTSPASNTFVRVFSEAFPRSASAEDLARIRGEGMESDSTSRQLARYVCYVAEREQLAIRPKLIFRQDRFLRGGDHSAFNESGFPAIRFSVPAEDYTRQHADVIEKDGKPYGDTAAFVDPEYIANVARLNLSSLIHLANAPSPPPKVKLLTKALTTDTTIGWEVSPDADTKGYEIMLRDTTSPDWEYSIDVGLVTEKTLKISKDNTFFGVRAYDADGYRSVVVFAMASRE